MEYNKKIKSDISRYTKFSTEFQTKEAVTLAMYGRHSGEDNGEFKNYSEGSTCYKF